MTWTMNHIRRYSMLALMAWGLLFAPMPVWSADQPNVAGKSAATKESTSKKSTTKKSGTKKSAETQQATSADKAGGSSYSNQEFGFSFTYPEAWIIRPGTMPNMRVKVADRAEQPAAECALIAKRFPKAVSAKQAEIDQIFTTPPTTAELEEVLGEGGNAVKVTKASVGSLHKRPAHVGRVYYKVGTNAYASGQVVMTATPGLTWTLSCSGLGDTPANAEKNYHLWESAIDNLIASFTFK
jgi:hypothetical protein